MRITDELREWASVEVPYKYGHQLLAIANRIDNRVDDKHERVKCEYEREFEEWKHTQDTCYIKLPVDADGVPIRIGDVMEWPTGETFEVVGIGDGTLFYIEDDGEYADWTGAITKRHHHTLTVEDVLRQVIASANNGTHVHGALDTEQIVAEYASKLRLANDE